MFVYVCVRTIGLHDLLVTSIMKTDLDLRRVLYSQIVLSGGSTLFQGTCFTLLLFTSSRYHFSHVISQLFYHLYLFVVVKDLAKDFSTKFASIRYLQRRSKLESPLLLKGCTPLGLADRYQHLWPHSKVCGLQEKNIMSMVLTHYRKRRCESRT